MPPHLPTSPPHVILGTAWTPALPPRVQLLSFPRSLPTAAMVFLLGSQTLGFLALLPQVKAFVPLGARREWSG